MPTGLVRLSSHLLEHQLQPAGRLILYGQALKAAEKPRAVMPGGPG